MAEGIVAKPPLWFWIVSGLSTLWSIMGCTAYYMQVSISDADLAKLPPAQQEIWRMMPEWVTAAYAIAVFVGLAGSISLLLRKAWARPLFIVSLVAVLIQFGWTFLATPILSTVGAVAAIPFPAFIILVSALLVWLANSSIQRGWLR